ncbi:hypothetical protein F5B20DRAFT_92182 [Whalleya microplaca]|nr:hypothetical protein F5B20DRAFT_92182 [Whalleya microplaca]
MTHMMFAVLTETRSPNRNQLLHLAQLMWPHRRTFPLLQVLWDFTRDQIIIEVSLVFPISLFVLFSSFFLVFFYAYVGYHRTPYIYIYTPDTVINICITRSKAYRLVIMGGGGGFLFFFYRFTFFFASKRRRSFILGAFLRE